VPRIAPQPGPQTVFSATPADIAIYGGSAGGGKTWSLAYEAARYVHVPGYAAVIFRRTSPELTGGGSIWEEASRLYPLLGGRSREGAQLDWRFHNGRSVVEFRHLQHEKDVAAHQSKQYSTVGFDELTHFRPLMFWYLLSRLRGTSKVPKRLRGTCNPDPDSFVRELIDWYIGEDGLALDARSGVIRWFARVDERLLWGPSPEAVVAQEPLRIRRRGEPPSGPDDARPEPMSFTFVRARASDNQALLRSDPGYLARLSMLPGAQAKRLRDGNWDVRDAPGDYFDRSWVKLVEGVAEVNVRRRVRYWDKASTSPHAGNADPDWTRGVRVALLDDGMYVVEDLVSLRAGPAAVEKLIRQTAELDGVQVEVGCWQDPGQAGVVDIEHTRDLLLGFVFHGIRATQDKTTYAKVWTPLAKAGRVGFVKRPYLAEVFGELEGFPLRTHDDIMDALSGAFQLLVGGAWSYAYDAAPDDRHGTPRRDAWDDEDEDEDAPAARGACF